MSEAAILQQRLAGLSREQRALLFEQLRKRKEKESAATAPERIPRRPAGLETVPASFAQERLWFMDRLAPGNPAFNIPTALRIRGEVAPALLAAVLAEIVRRHEALRTTFRERGGQPVQVIAPPGPWSLPVVDLADLAAEARSAEARRLAREEAERPFAIERGPLLRAVLLRSGTEDHALLLNMHHIVSDGWSMGVLVGEITAIYGAAVAGAPSPLPELPIQYADFARWQRERLQGEVLERQIAYWRERLEGAPASLDLPTDRPRPSAQTYRGARLRVDLGPDFARVLRQLARRGEASPFMALLAGFMALLGRLTGQGDLTVGSPIANRHRAEVEPLIGFFVNTLVMRGDLRSDPPFGDWLAQVRRTTLEAFAHQDLPFERLVEELRPERHLAVTPLFQVVCAVQNAPVGRMELPGLALSPFELEAATTQFDLELHAWEAGDSLEVMISYSTELFDGSTVLRLARRLGTLLHGAMADSGRRLTDLPLLAAAERHQLLCEWNDSTAEPPPAGVAERVTAWAVRSPEATAVVCGGSVLTYGELLERASGLAGELGDLGVGPDVLVGLCADRSPELVVGAFAVLLAGGAYLPLDSSYPEDRLAFVARESGMAALLVRGPEAPLWAGAGLPVLRLDRAAGPAPRSAVPAATENLAYVIYTSGSTGRPKGVEVSSAGLLNLVEWHQRTYRVVSEDRATLVASPAFDASVWEIWPYLAAGASLHVPDEDLRLAPDRLLDWLADEGITLCFLPTPLAEQVLEAAASALPPGLSLRALLTGGDRLQRPPRASLPFALVNHYGPTETSVVATSAPIESTGPVYRPPAIGRPVAAIRAHVLDARLDPAPVGIPGELFLGGAGLARGYRFRPELTAERFVPDPFSRAPGERLYRTGDQVRLLPDGNLEFLGRIDTQVKLRGFRIELGEIESVLRRHPAVREAVVELRDGGSSGPQLAAYVVCQPASELPADSGEASAHVSEWRSLYDETYGRGEAVEAAFDVVGWNSSFTGEPIPAAEMREWVERTVERIDALRPRRVLEIGCGTGLLLLRLAPRADRYVGTDFSPMALERLRRRLTALPQVELRQAAADDWSGVAPGEADLVILNSVVQYFPGVDYLVRVLEKAVRAVSPGGAVFVGDVRSRPLLETLHTAVELFQAPPSRGVDELRRRVRRRLADEEELVVEPSFFFALAARLPAVRRISLVLKRGRWHNELTCFRYDVVLHTGDFEAAAPAAVAASSLAEVERLLAARPEALAVAGLRNARVAAEAAILDLLAGGGWQGETVEDLRRAVAERTPPGVDPEALAELGERSGYDVALTVEPASPCHFGAVLRRRGGGAPAELAARPVAAVAQLPWSAYANDPLAGRRSRRLVPELRRFLQTELPDYMVPSSFALLDRLPLTAHGKVDRTALPEPEPLRGGTGGGTPPRTQAEARMAALWQEVLGIEQVGREDNFFELGGHSLLATQLVSRANDAFGIELPLRLLFERPVLADLAGAVSALAPADALAGDRAPCRRLGLTEAPLSFAQERLWFIDRLMPGTAVYNIPLALAIDGDLSPAALEAALGEIARRHDSLRTTFSMRGEVPVQIISPSAPWILPRVDLSSLPGAVRAAEIHRLAADAARRPFDLGRGPLLRAALLRSGAREHTLLLAMHHIVSDGWSMGVLVREITALYGAVRAGRPSPLPELPVQYADFAVWQRAWLAGGELARQLAYWRERLAGVPESLDLPADLPRPPVPTWRGGRVLAKLAPELARDLARLARRHDVTLFMLILAVFQTLLRRLTGQQDVPVGSPIANRNRAEIEPLIGFFVNTLVLRGDLAGDPPFRELLGRVRHATLEAYSHQDLPFETLVEELRPQRHLSVNPLFQVMCAVQNTPADNLDLSGLSLVPLELEATTAQFDLELNVWGAEDLALAFSYSADVFDAATGRRIAGHFETLLRAVVADAERPLRELPLLADGERHQLLREWSDRRRDGDPRGVVERFAAQVERTPDAVALEAGGERLTYAELDRRANRLGHRLRRLGVGPGVPVGLFTNRSAGMVAGLLAVWKAGGAFLPLDPGHPWARLSYLLEDSGAAVIATHGRLAESLPPHEARLVLLDADDLAGESDRAPEGTPRASDLAYLIYTSGTTGRPKAVEVEHANLASTLAAVQEAFGFRPGDRMPAIASFSFDVFLFELLGPLLAGGTSALLPLRPALDLERLMAELESATLLHAVPAVMRQVVELERRRSAEAPALRGVFTGGDAVPADLLADLREAFPRARTWVLYGPTETAIVCTGWPVPAAGPVRSLLGRPLAGAEVRICDETGRPVPAGVPGEIWIGGGGVARGYWRRAELTAEKFVEVDGRRFFRSGDLARWLPAGALEFLGRADQQVKVRGFRIELGEIESSLLRHPQVREAVADVRPAPGEGGRQLVAYVVPAAAASAAEESAEQVAQWRDLYDQTYERSQAADPTFDTEGWNSSYTGRPIPQAEMREWVEGTVERILALRPRRVLEAGCGTGLLLARLAPQTERYVGTDFSRVALDGLRRRMQGLPQVELRQRAADDWSGVAAGEVDLVILNSVVQYFPGVDYLVRVLQGAVRALAPGGAVFVGDVRSRPLLEALHASVELSQAPPDREVAELRRRVRRRVADEEELVLDPVFFFALAKGLPAVRRVSLLLKRGRRHNELTRFRFDVVLHVGERGTVPAPAAVEAPSWKEIERLLSRRPEALAVTGLVNSRLELETAVLELLAGSGQEIETVEELRRAVAERTAPGVDPEELAQLGRRLGYAAELTVDPASPFRFGAIFGRRGSRAPAQLAAAAALDLAELPWSALANDPLAGKRTRRLVPELRRFLQAELPDYMVPTSFVLLDRLPLSAHGKVDRAALPAPAPPRGGRGGEAPRTPVEEKLAAIWREVLGLDEVGREDDFFELGGHSLLATQLASRTGAAFGFDLPLRLIFERPTLGELAAVVQERTPLPPIPRRPPDLDRIPASFAQERLWFLDRLEPGGAAYNLPTAVRLLGELSPPLLEAVFGEVVRRHETLRTSFGERDGQPVQVIAAPGRWRLPLVDLSVLPAAARAAEARRLARQEALRAFDLERGPLLRAALLRLDTAEHGLLLTMHHIVSDGWSMGVLVREIGALYEAALAGRPPRLPELPIQYADFALWQRAWLREGELERQLSYWRQRLAGVPAVLALPTDRLRPAAPSHRGAQALAVWDPDLGRRLNRLARREGATLFMVLLAAFQLLLRRLAGQEDVAVGSPIANRNRTEIEPLIGFFVNTLVLRGDLTGDPSFRELLARVRNATLEAYNHQDLPFERLVEELRPERHLGVTPLFQVLCTLQNAPFESMDLPGLSFAPLELEATTTRFDLELDGWEVGEELSVRISYRAELFDAPTILRLAAHLKALVRAAVADPGRRLSELPLLSGPALHQLIVEWSDTETAFPAAASIPELFAGQAALRPDAMAVEQGEERLTYGELQRRAGRLARRLVDLGIRPQERVAVLAERSPELIVALLGILRAGGAYLPLDPSHPPERLARVLAGAGAAGLVADAPPEMPLPAGLRLVLPDDEGAAGPAELPAVPAEALAYVMYTSGSTGSPKGVAVTHRNVVRLVRGADYAAMGPEQAWLQYAPVAFDASTLEIWAPLLNGGRLVLVPGRMASLADLARLIERSGVTSAWLTAGLFHQMVDGCLEGLQPLSQLLTGGDVISPAHARRALEAHPGLTLIDGYGPTEGTTFTCCQRLTDPRQVAESVPIGRPIANARVHVLDPELQPVPAGVWGELYAAGDGLAWGYLTRPELTAERFLPDPFGGPGERLYRTGDRVRRLAAGTLEIQGRLDAQVKVRGFRVEPGEVEAALLGCPGVRQAAVLAIGPPGDRALAAYWVGEADPAELRSRLRQLLPEPMVPARLVLLPALPLTANGKVDRHALERLRPETEAAADFEPPRNPLEERLAAVWEETLGVPRVGRNDNFFALGGHSLLATQLVSRVSAATGVDFPLRLVFERPALGELAEALVGLAPAAAVLTAAAGPRRPSIQAPLSFAQERLWFLDRLEPGGTAFNIPSPLLLRGPLDPGVLERAFQEVRRRQGSLRTRFEEREGSPVQVVDPPGPWRLPRIDLDGLSGPRRENEGRRIAGEEAALPFDLERGPLFRPVLVRLGEREHLLLLTCHHIITDGWSTGVLIGELTQHYVAIAAGGPPPPEPALQYADVSLRQRERLAAAGLEAQIAYWRRNLAGAPPLLDLPLDRPRPAVQTYRGEEISLRLPADLTAALKSVSFSERASLYMTLLAGLALLLHRWSGQEDVVVGSPVAGRQQRETEGLIGFFLNLLSMRVDLSGEPAFRELLRRARQTALQAYAHQDVPFERVLQELRLERETSYTPVFQVFLNMLNFPPTQGDLPGGVVVELMSLGRVESKYDFTLYAAEGQGGQDLYLNLVYNPDLFDRSRMEELLRQYRLLLAQVVRDPGAPIGAFSLVTPEAAAVLPDPATPLGELWHGAVHELFLAQARRHPQSAAVVDPEGSWTYGELADATGRLAAHLRSAGLERGDRVAVWAHRGAPVAWAVMGTLAAGGAFVMLDPAYPAARLVEILRLAGPRAWLMPAAAGAPPRQVEELLADWERESRLLCRVVLPGGPAAARRLLAELPTAAEPAATGPDDVAFVAFTSGSTGVPKGILGRHGPLSHFLPWQCQRFGLTAADRYSLLSGLAHDPLQRDLFTSLCTGATLCAPAPEQVLIPGRLAAWAAAEGITVAHLTPAMGQVLTEPPGDGSAPPSIPSLRWVFLVGDVLTRSDVDRIRRLAPEVSCVNLYGSTETQRAVGYHVVDPQAGAAGQRARQVLPLGRGMEDVQILVVNATERLAGVGEVGEIWMRSPHLAHGYLGDEELTRERFRINPFTGRGTDRIYRTGDLGRYEPNGEVTFAGRADRQVKLRGFRIEPGEIESAIGRLEGVRESVVVLREDGGECYLAAYVVPEPGAEPGLAGRLRPLLASRLPDYMVPAVFVELPALPLTPNGKVDRRALPAPPRQGLETGAEPRTPVEEALAGIWASLLRRDRIGVHDNFFELGGHSLLATQMVARVRAVLGVELPLRALFETPTVAGLSARIEAAWRVRETGLPAPPPLRPARREGDLPLSFAQERLWFLARIAPESAAYNMPAAVKLLGGLDRAALAATLSEIRRRHETLRTTFRLSAGEPMQVIQAAAPLPLPLIDLAGLPPAARDGEARRLAEAEALTPFDLAAGPLLRARLLRLAADEHALLWTTHHVVSDAWSVGAVLVRELAALYEAFSQGRPSPLSELSIQYADYAVWQREWLRGPVLAEQLGYWRRQLAAAAPLDLPADRPRRPVPSTRGASRPWHLPAEPAEALRRLARAEGATLFMVLHAGFAALLHLYTGRTDVLVGAPLANRGRTELEGLIGFFVNTLVLRTGLAGDPTFREAVARSREAALGAYAHQDLPFEKLVDELGLPRDPFRPPLLRVILQLRNVPFEGLEMPGLALAPFGAVVETAKFDLVVNLAEAADGVAGEFRYDTDLFDPATVDRLGGHFAGLLATWAEEPGGRLSTLSVLGEAERHQLLLEWNGGEVSRQNRGLHHRFEDQVDRHPDAPALSAGGERLTYRQLDERANRLARHLLAAGVRPGDRVALELERSAEMVAAILAVLKTGAAYVPLDPNYPAERLAFALEDSGASLLVTDGILAAQRAEIERRSGERLEVATDPEFPAYVIYTSGSTGRPKGVVVSHANVDRLLAATAPWFDFGADDVWTLFHSYAFDFSVWELWGALLHGGRLVVVPYWESRSPEDFFRLLRDERVTVLNQTPSAFRQLVWAEEAAPSPPLALRWVVFGGEALEPASLSPWFARHGDERPRLVNMYGITETTVHVTFRPVRATDLGRGSVLGGPIPDLSLHVLDAFLRPQPIGVPGELHVGGAGLAQGYLGRPELTAERFVPDPFPAEPGARLYRSGDLARRLPDGDLEYLGRIDHQVKIRGFRIELGEIEAALIAHREVRAAVVLAREDRHSSERRLAAYVVPAPAGAPDPAALREHLALRLPDYMLPSAFVFLDELPLTANGKVDRRALPAPEEAEAPKIRRHEPPRTPLERFLAGRFREVLGLPAEREIGLRDDFFELGGTSITGAIFIHRLQEALAEIVHVVAIFDHPTVAALADYVREQHAGAARRLWGEGAVAEGESHDVVGPTEVAEMDRLIAAGRPAPLLDSGEPLNPPALFVLAPPRSGTTLLRVMLGAHPRLFAPPELELLSFQTLAERRDAFQGRDAFWLEGLVRAVMEARQVGADEAERIVAERERRGWTTRRLYGELQEWLGDRLLVDKTPSYALDPEVLRRAEESFAGARYLHLLRHPQAANRSFEEAKLDQIFFRRPHSFTRRQLAELIWTVSHRNILGFLAGVPRERWTTVRFEELVREPDRVLSGVCDFLGISYHPEMAEPYREGVARMVDGPHKESRMLGDVKFLGHGRIDPAAAERWRQAGEAPLGEPAREIANVLGYAAAPGRGVLVPLQQGSPEGRPLFCVHPVGGEVVAYRELARRLGPDQPVYGLQSPDPPLTDVQEMAARYLAAVGEVQPEGPYRLAGWSMGGIVAYEMARQLEERGETAEVLALIDVAAPSRWSGEPEPDAAGMVALFASDLARLHGLELPPVDLSGLDEGAALAAVRDLGRQAGLLPASAGPAEVRRLFDRFRANRRALSTYEARPYAGEVVLFCAADRLAKMDEPDPTLGWGELLNGRLQLTELPGDHYALLRQEVGSLADLLRRHL